MDMLKLILLLVVGYACTVIIEVPILCIGLSSKHETRDRVCNGLLLTAFSYPIVIMVIPAALDGAGITSRLVCLGLSETYAPVSEVLLFRYLVHQPLFSKPDRDTAAIFAANLTSFLAGEVGVSEWINAIVGCN